ncbi:MAG TPA: cyclodeaminase/cyclohydrolase family protein [Firmicutes bacterium]|nr:cyclodeaminase/cyclohydrolase family protein [Bacillota bacterium]
MSGSGHGLEQGLEKATIEQFLTELGSASPAPGGGTVAALAGAQAAALVSMVASLTLAKKKRAVTPAGAAACAGAAASAGAAGSAGAADLADALSEAQALIHELSGLGGRDTAAFLEVMAAYRMSREDPGRGQAIQSALRGAAEVPLEVMRCAIRILPLARMVLEQGIASARTDAAVAAIMAHAALQGAALNAMVNLETITDQEFVRTTIEEVAALRKKGAETYSQIVSSVFAGLEDNLVKKTDKE